MSDFVYVLIKYLLSNLLYSKDGGAIEVFLVAAGLDKEMCLNVFLHFLHTCHKVVVSAVHFSVSRRSSCIWSVILVEGAIIQDIRTRSVYCNLAASNGHALQS